MGNAFREKVRQDILPFLESKGFKKFNRMVNGAPFQHRDFIEMKRVTDGKLQLVELQFSKYLKPWFSFAMAEFPNGPYTAGSGRVYSVDEIGVSHSLYEGYAASFKPNILPGLGRFRVSRIGRLLKGGEKAIDDTIHNFKNKYPHVEEWFSSKKEGPWIRVVRFSRITH
jgi:hypothetical protein